MAAIWSGAISPRLFRINAGRNESFVCPRKCQAESEQEISNHVCFRSNPAGQTVWQGITYLAGVPEKVFSIRNISKLKNFGFHFSRWRQTKAMVKSFG
jgi:hypothetical protein